jgi:ATP-dependent exoDNAse (exonuclease V) beta subunit
MHPPATPSGYAYNTDGPGSLSPAALAAMPAGRDAGSVVHAVLEQVDFSAADLPAPLGQLRAQIAHVSAVANKSHSA